MKTPALIFAQCIFCLISSLAFSSQDEPQKLPPLETAEAREHEAFLRFRNYMPSHLIGKRYDELNAQWIYETQVNAPYVSLYLPLSRQVRDKASALCRSVGGLQVDKPERYVKGEIPCGMVPEGGTDKSLYIVTLPSWSFTEGDWSYEMSGGSISVSLIRANRTEIYRQPDLDTKQIPERKNSELFGDDVSVRYSGEALEVCAIIPGASLSAKTSTRTVTATHVKSGQREESVIEVSGGGGSFTQARVCKMIDLKSGKSTPGSGMKLKITDSRVAPMRYGSSPPIMEKIRQYDMELLEKDLRKNYLISENADADYISEGKWIPDLIAKNFSLAAINGISSMTESVLGRLALPKDEKDFRRNLEDRCHLLSTSRDFEYGALWTHGMESFCENSLSRIKYEFLPSKKDKIQEDKGCYYGFARVHDIMNRDRSAKWWATECEVQGQYRASLPVDLESYKAEFETLLNMTSNFSGVPKSWQPHLEALDIDAYQFWRLLYVWDAKDKGSISEWDWTAAIPELAPEFR